MTKKIKRILFITGTRADFGKIKPLISNLNASGNFEITTFVTGMHMMETYGSTWRDVEKSGISNFYKFINQHPSDLQSGILAKTILGLTDFLSEYRFDAVVVHGDRIEALAGAQTAVLMGIRVIHIEGGEVSGTIDDSIRHAVSKLSHWHFISNDDSKLRLVAMGEEPTNVYVIGSPEVDIMLSDGLPTLEEVKLHYQIPFEDYSILAFHPVATEQDELREHTKEIVNFIIESKKNYVVILPNNDQGNEKIREEYSALHDNKNFLIFPSMRFEYYLTLLRHSRFIIGNSSSGIREAPVFGVPSINIGSRQYGRVKAGNKDNHKPVTIFNVSPDRNSIHEAFQNLPNPTRNSQMKFGEGNSASRFAKILSDPIFWKRSHQKYYFEGKE